MRKNLNKKTGYYLEGKGDSILLSKKILVGPKIPWAEIHVTRFYHISNFDKC
jgi:hypothetical protein